MQPVSWGCQTIVHGCDSCPVKIALPSEEYDTGPSPMSLRRETPADIAAIREVETAAFGRTGEARLVDGLRAAGALVFSGVAEVGGKIVGHIAFSPVRIEGERGSFVAIALAPMAVHPQWQRKGIGSALIRWSLDECRRNGHELVIVVGHPNYYPRFGFVPAMPLGIRCRLKRPVKRSCCSNFVQARSPAAREWFVTTPSLLRCKSLAGPGRVSRRPGFPRRRRFE